MTIALRKQRLATALSNVAMHENPFEIASVRSPRHRHVWSTAALFGLLSLTLTSRAIAQPPTWVGSGNPLAKAANADSYIRTSDGVLLWDGATNIPAAATNLPATLNTFPGPTVDVLMQQCFGGGFSPGMQASINQYTITTATNWNELALNTPTNPVNNFTSSWNQSFPRSEGLYQHYLDATNGAAAAPPNPAVVADPYGPNGASRTAMWFENPTFASPDALVAGKPNPNGPNNGRDIVANNQWAVLYAPQVATSSTNPAPAPRFGQNIDAIYQSLLTLIPANHIIVLYGNNAANTMTPGGTPINGPATLANFQNASRNGTGLYGNITGQTAPGNPNAQSHLFVYTTGHGGSWTAPGGTVIANPIGVDDIKVTAKPANDFTDVNGSNSNVGNLSFEIAFASHVSTSGVSIKFDGTTLGPISDEGTSPLIDLSPMIGTSFYWEVNVPLSLLTLNFGLPDNIEIDGLSSGAGLVSAVTYDDFGDAWSVGIQSVPEPTTLTLQVTALASLATVFLVRSRKRGRNGSPGGISS